MHPLVKSLFSIFYQNKTRGFLFQVVVLVSVIALFYHFTNNVVSNIEARGINVGFSFLTSESGFAISESLISYDESSNYLRVFYVGILNTLYVSIIAIIFSSLIGLIVGISRLSSNWLVRKFSSGYIELFRNIPLLLQILFWYNLIINTFPPVRQSITFFDIIFVNLRGIYLPKMIPEAGFFYLLMVIFVIIVGTFLFKYYARIQKEKTGKTVYGSRYVLAAIFIIPLAYYLLDRPLHFEISKLSGFNFRGGLIISTEFFALVFALSIYTATYIAEAIRSGIESVNKGQKEAAKSLGLTTGQSLKFVILPQALRVAVPPIISQYLNVAKNSSLAVAIGYPDLVSVFTGTTLNKVGQALEIIMMTMLVYLVISLLISLILNIINHKLKIKER